MLCLFKILYGAMKHFDDFNTAFSIKDNGCTKTVQEENSL